MRKVGQQKRGNLLECLLNDLDIKENLLKQVRRQNFYVDTP
jgi:hypothetical protein